MAKLGQARMPRSTTWGGLEISSLEDPRARRSPPVRLSGDLPCGVVLAESHAMPAILEARYGGGKVVPMALTPDKYRMAGSLFENIIETYSGGRAPPEK